MINRKLLQPTKSRRREKVLSFLQLTKTHQAQQLLQLTNQPTNQSRQAQQVNQPRYQPASSFLQLISPQRSILLILKTFLQNLSQFRWMWTPPAPCPAPEICTLLLSVQQVFLLKVLTKTFFHKYFYIFTSGEVDESGSLKKNEDALLKSFEYISL